MSIEVQDGQIMVPGNAEAEEVRRRREENVSLDEQIRTLMAAKVNNAEIIGRLSTSAVWIPTGEYVPEEPPTEPEDEEPPAEPGPEDEETDHAE